MRELVAAICAVLIFSVSGYGQKYFSKTGYVHFLSEAPIETIEATNNNSYVVFDATSGQMEWSVLIKGFKFEKALMQDHFNENYMESHKYPKAVFKGKADCGQINFSKDGQYSMDVSGNMTIHGVTKPLNSPAKLIIKDGLLSVSGTFDIAIADYGIEVPKVVRENIAKNVKVTVKAGLQPLK